MIRSLEAGAPDLAQPFDLIENKHIAQNGQHYTRALISLLPVSVCLMVVVVPVAALVTWIVTSSPHSPKQLTVPEREARYWVNEIPGGGIMYRSVRERER